MNYAVTTIVQGMAPRKTYYFIKTLPRGFSHSLIDCQHVKLMLWLQGWAIGRVLSISEIFFLSI